MPPTATRICRVERLSDASSSAAPVHRYRDDADTAVQRGLDLQADEIARVVQTTKPVLVGDGQPPLANDGHQVRARTDRDRDHLGEIIAGLERVDVLEHPGPAETLSEPLEQPPSRVIAIPLRGRRRTFASVTW